MRASSLTLEEQQELRAALDNRLLVSAILKVMADEADYWRRMGRSQALTDDPKTALLIQYAARESEATQIESVLAKGAGIQRNQERD